MPFIIPIAIAAGSAIAAGTAAVVGAVATFGFAAGALTFGVGAGEALAALAPAVVEFGALAGASALLTPKPKVNTSGSPQAFKADPYSPIPVVMARYGVAGALVYETTSGGATKAEHGGAGNEYLTQFVVLSGLGPVPLESTRLDDTVLSFGGQTCTGGYIEADYVQSYNPGYKQNSNGSYQNDNYKDHYWQYSQTGSLHQGWMNYPDKIRGSGDNLPEWDDAHRLTFFAAVSVTRSYDTSVWAGGPGQPLWTASAGTVQYDPRQDSTYAGGDGAQRWVGPADPAEVYGGRRSNWAPSDNPIIHALNYALGYYIADPSAVGDATKPPNRRYAGVGAGPAGVDVDAFVRAANNADANGWKVTGQWTTGDGKRSVLTAMLQAGGAQLVSDRGRISCTFSAPVVAVNANAPLTWADLAGEPSLDTTTSVRERFNTVFYSYTSEAHRWQVVQADTPVEAATYVAEDGGVVRSKKLTFEYVPTVNQAAQLAAYAIVDGRELPNIVLPGKPHLRGYSVGDAVLVDLPELGLHLAKLVVLKRSTDPVTGIVTLTCRSETDAKHAYALGLSGIAPPTPAISGFDPTVVPAPIPASWAAQGVAVNDAVTGEIVHVIRINGSTIDNVYATQVVVTFALVTSVNGEDVEGSPSSETFAASQEQIDLNLPAGRWHVWLRYVTISGAEDVDNTLDLGIITVDGTTAASTASVPGSAAFGDTGETVTEVLAAYDAQIAQLTKDVQDGVSAVSADAQAAAASALAAESAEQASASAEAAAQQAVNDSQAARDAAGVARDAALNDAGAAQASATQAGGAAGNAQTYASQASVAAGSASANASAAMIAGVSATTAAASSFPERVGSAGQYFSLTYNGAPGSVGPIPSSGPTSVVSDSALGLVITEAGIGQDIVTQGALPYVAGRTYEVTLDYVQRANGAAARTADVVCMGLDASYATTAPVFSTAAPAISDGARQTLTWRFADAGGANTTAIATSSSLTWLRFSARLNLVADRSSRATDATASMVRLSVKDITQEITAQGFANAAATSASSAAASQSNAGQSASSASTSATNANTSAGQASTDAGQASTSASNAQGSANTAGTYAGQASVSASGAAAYAGQANTSATDAQGFASSASTYSNQAQGYSGSAQNYASSAGSSAAAASSNAAAAQQSATLSASVSTNALNPNCDFNVWSNAAYVPDGYAFWANSDNTSRGGGVNGKPYAVLQSPAAGEQLGFTMGGLRKSRGWYVIEADVRIKGSFAGAGVAFNTSSEDLTVSFAQDPDTNGIVRSTSENDYWVYKWRKLVQANVEDYGASLFAFTACTGLGDVSAVRSIYWDHVAVRPATDGEIAGKQALTDANSALAQISSNASAQASLNTAQATTNATLSAQVNTRPNLLAPLETGISGWRTYNGAGLYAGTNYWGAIAYLGGIASGQTVCTIDSPYVTMPGGVVLTAALDSVGIDSDSSILTQSQIVSVNASGQETTVAYNQFTGSHDFSTDPGARNKLACSGTTPSDCVKVYVRTVFYLNSGSFQACQVRQVKLEKGGLPCTAYSTEAGVSSLAASVSISQGAIATLQGKSVAWWQLNVNAADSQAYILAQADGQAGSAIAIAADYISLYNRAAGSIIKALQVIGGNVYVANRLYVGSTIYLDPAIPAIVFDNGSAAFALGTRLGANADMIAWFGPSQPVTSMTRTNAAFYLGTDGTAFFSGAIRAGKLYNSIQGTDSGASAQTTLGPFGTQGGTITVPWSYSWYRTGQRVGNQSASGSTSVTVTLYRTAAGQAEQQVDQLNVTGQTTAEFDGEYNNTLFTETMSGSKTFSDTYGGTLNRTYRVQISNRVITTFNGSTYQNKPDGIQQTLGLVSSEG